MAEFPTYAYEGDKVIAYDGTTEIASGTKFSKVAAKAEEHFSELSGIREAQDHVKVRDSATHITTPNGERGVILGRTQGLWSDEITVRFDNGQIRHYATYADDGLEYEAAVESTPHISEFLQARLDEMPDPTIAGLTARINELKSIRNDVGRLITAGVSHGEAERLHGIALGAELETRECREALAYLQDAEETAIVPPKQSYHAVEQADMGHTASDDWLEVVAQQMVAETESQDFRKLLEDGPTLFVSSLDDGAIGHTGTVRELAEQHIHSKTAGFQGDEIEEYRSQFVARTELARRREASYRQEVSKQEVLRVEASLDDAPDEALFL